MSCVITETKTPRILRLQSQEVQLSTNESEESPLPVHTHVKNLIDQMGDTKLFAPETLSIWYEKFLVYLQKAEAQPNDQSLKTVAFSICYLMTKVLIPTLDACEEHPQNQETINNFMDAFIPALQQFISVDSKDFATKFQNLFFHMLKKELADACAFDIEDYACETGNKNLQLIQDKFKKTKQRVLSICDNNASLMKEFQSKLATLSKKIEQIESRLTDCANTTEGLADQIHGLHLRETAVLEKLKTDN